MSQVIGEGSYGCALKPSLKCKNKRIDYHNKISKFMLSTHAKTEIKEYTKIDKADKDNKFYLGKPILCNPAETLETRDAIDECRNFKRSSDLKDHKLIVMEDGGLNLKDYTDKIIKKMKKNGKNIEKVEKVLIEMQRMLWGLVVLLENDAIHHDLKPENIVYNEKNNRMNFIDFGLMTSLRKAKRDCQNGSYKFAIEHWSFPIEMKFIDVLEYSRMANLSKERKDTLFTNYLDLIKSNNSHPARIAFSYLLGGNNPSDQSIDAYMREYYYFLIDDVKLNNYSKILLNTLETIDSYGVGLAFGYLISNCDHLLDDNIHTDLQIFFLEMAYPNALTRRSARETLIQYEEKLEKYGLLKKHGKRFDNHELVKRTQMPKQIERKIDSLDSIDIILSANELEKASSEPIRLCPDGKEVNPVTKRCVNVCKPGFSRNEKFQCKKQKPIKIKENKSQKPCPEGKEKNPKTKRCVNVCKPGFSRNENFQCKKTRKNSKNSV